MRRILLLLSVLVSACSAFAGIGGLSGRVYVSSYRYNPNDLSQSVAETFTSGSKSAQVSLALTGPTSQFEGYVGGTFTTISDDLVEGVGEFSCGSLLGASGTKLEQNASWDVDFTVDAVTILTYTFVGGANLSGGLGGAYIAAFNDFGSEISYFQDDATLSHTVILGPGVYQFNFVLSSYNSGSPFGPNVLNTIGDLSFQLKTAPVPEPASMLSLGAAVAGVLGRRRGRVRKSSK